MSGVNIGGPGSRPQPAATDLRLAVQTTRAQLEAHLKEASWPDDVRFYAEELALAISRNTVLDPGEVRPHVRVWLTELRCELLALNLTIPDIGDREDETQ